MTTLSPSGPPGQPAPPRRLSLPTMPDCLPAPRAGAPRMTAGPTPRGIAALPQRAPRESALALTASGFPGLSLDLEHERGSVGRQAAERDLERIGLAYLRAERSAGAPLHDQATALSEALRQLDRARGARLELTGPVSLCLQIIDDQERPLAYDPPLREALTQHLIMRATWLRDHLALSAGSALICLDEPFLDALGSPFCPLDWDEGMDLLARALTETPGPRGLCVAGAPRWADLLEQPADIIFFDAFEQSAALIQAAGAVAAHLARGGALGWGIIPNDPGALAQERAETLARRFVSSVEYLADAGGIEPEQVCRAALISTSGRLGHLPADIATHAATLCGEVSAQLRAKYGLDT